MEARVVVWNADLDASRLRGQSPSAALRDHAVAAAALLRGVGGDRLDLDADAFLPVRGELATEKASFTGVIGSFEIYRSEAVGHRMACLRVVLR